MALAFGEIVAGLKPAKEFRTFQPVRRNSYHADDRRALAIWRPIASSKRDARRLIAARIKAAEFYDRHHKQAGKRNGPLGHIGIEVLRELYRFVDFKSGRCDPAIDTICAKVRRSRAAVVRAMARLRSHGFLDWIRRTEPTDNEGAGPQVRQISNAYGFGLPAFAAKWVKKICGSGPTPDCEVARREAAEADLQAMHASGTAREFVDFLGGPAETSEILSRMAEHFDNPSASSPKSQNPAPERI